MEATNSAGLQGCSGCWLTSAERGTPLSVSSSSISSSSGTAAGSASPVAPSNPDQSTISLSRADRSASSRMCRSTVRAFSSPRRGSPKGSHVRGARPRGKRPSSMPSSATTRNGTERMGSSAQMVTAPVIGRSPRWASSKLPCNHRSSAARSTLSSPRSSPASTNVSRCASTSARSQAPEGVVAARPSSTSPSRRRHSASVWGPARLPLR